MGKSVGDYRTICTGGYDEKLNMSEKSYTNTVGALISVLDNAMQTFIVDRAHDACHGMTSGRVD
jgi:hypothetical protein